MKKFLMLIVLVGLCGCQEKFEMKFSSENQTIIEPFIAYPGCSYDSVKVIKSYSGFYVYRVTISHVSSENDLIALRDRNNALIFRNNEVFLPESVDNSR